MIIIVSLIMAKRNVKNTTYFVFPMSLNLMPQTIVKWKCSLIDEDFLVELSLKCLS